MWQKIIDAQYRRPSGMLGWWIGRRMAAQHRPENAWTVTLLDPQPAHSILEIGFGPGIALQAVSAKVQAGRVVGLDVSRTMVQAATRRNRDAIRQGRVALHHGEASRLPFPDGDFDQAYSIHSLYFWQQPLAALKEIHRVLKPGGRLILTILPKEKWGAGNPDAPVGTPQCTPYSGAELETLLHEAGFAHTEIQADSHPAASPSSYSVMGYR